MAGPASTEKVVHSEGVVRSEKIFKALAALGPSRWMDFSIDAVENHANHARLQIPEKDRLTAPRPSNHWSLIPAALS